MTVSFFPRFFFLLEKNTSKPDFGLGRKDAPLLLSAQSRIKSGLLHGPGIGNYAQIMPNPSYQRFTCRLITRQTRPTGYGFYSNSAIAVNTFVRSIAGAGFPLFAPAMYHNLVKPLPLSLLLKKVPKIGTQSNTNQGVPWATSLLGFLCVAFAPVPVLFYIYGARIRSKSRFTPTG